MLGLIWGGISLELEQGGNTTSLYLLHPCLAGCGGQAAGCAGGAALLQLLRHIQVGWPHAAAPASIQPSIVGFLLPGAGRLCTAWQHHLGVLCMLRHCYACCRSQQSAMMASQVNINPTQERMCRVRGGWVGALLGFELDP